MISFTERKKRLLQDIAIQRNEIARLEATVKEAQALLLRLEGAALLCDEFIAEQGAEKQETS